MEVLMEKMVVNYQQMDIKRGFLFGFHGNSPSGKRLHSYRNPHFWYRQIIE
jgi:hypothetical protein